MLRVGPIGRNSSEMMFTQTGSTLDWMNIGHASLRNVEPVAVT